MITDLKKSGVTILNYRLFNDLECAANKLGVKINTTLLSYSFRIYDEKGLTKYIHIHYK